MQVAIGRVRTHRLDERSEDWQTVDLLDRIDQMQTKNGMLRAKLNEARDRLALLEMQNRHLRKKILRAVSPDGGD
jgi:hypothetical protein